MFSCFALHKPGPESSCFSVYYTNFQPSELNGLFKPVQTDKNPDSIMLPLRSTSKLSYSTLAALRNRQLKVQPRHFSCCASTSPFFSNLILNKINHVNGSQQQRRGVKTSNTPQVSTTKPKKSGVGFVYTTSILGDMGDVILRPGLEKRPPGPKTPEEFMDVYGQRNWVSWGYDSADYWEDRINAHMMTFCMFSVILGSGIFFTLYGPDYR